MNDFAAMFGQQQPTNQGNNPFGNIPLGNQGGANGGKSALDSVESVTRQVGARIVVSGVEKIGKTTLACGAPKALLIPLEMGFGSIMVPKTKQISTYGELMATIADIKERAQRGQFPYNSIVLDSATATEQRIHEKTIEGDKDYRPGNPKGLNMETALGGYGKAYSTANGLFGDLLSALDELAFYGGINVVFTAHVFAAKMIDPAFGEYDAWDLLLHSPKNNKNYGKREMLTQWADMIAFIHEPMFITKGDQIQQAQSMNSGRVAGVVRKPAYVAGNRFGIVGEIPIPTAPQGTPSNVIAGYSWNQIAQAVNVATGGQIDLFNRDV
jgi:hypothetical protein